MTPPIEGPSSKLVYSTDLKQRAISRDTFLVFATPVAAHLANLGHFVDQIVLKDNRICWRVPVAAQDDCHRYGETMRRMNEARRLTECKLQGGVYDGRKERVSRA
jgi:hypothetical protein